MTWRIVPRMTTRTLSADTMLSIQVGCVMTRNQFTQKPAAVMTELRETAGDRLDILAAEVGRFIGFYDDQWTHTLVEALRAEFTDLDLQPHIELGERRRNAGTHGTQGYAVPGSRN